MNNQRQFGWGSPLLISLALWIMILLVGQAALAQQPVLPGYQVCSTASGSTICSFQPTDLAHPLPVAATATISGFHPESSLSPITATTGGATSAAFAAGKAILVQNIGSTNAAYCFPGGAASTSSQFIAPNGSTLIQTSVETTITCVTSTSTTVLNLQVGEGLWTGSGAGAGSGGGGGSVTQGTDPWLVAGKGTAGTPSGGVVSVQGVAGGTALPVSGTVTATGPLTDTQLRASAVPISGTVTATPTGTQAVSGANGAFVANSIVDLTTLNTKIDTLNVTAANPLATQAISNVIGGVGLNATPTLVNGNGVVPTQGGAVLSATNGWYSNMLQGNIVLSATNGLFSNVLQGNAALSVTNGLFSNTLQGNAVLSLTNPGFTRVTDGTTGITVKPASTPSVATDTAIVVDQRPGSIVSALPGTLALGSTFVSGTTAAMTGTTSTQVIALVSSKIIYVTRMSCKGDPANAVGTKVQIRDGSAGTVLDTMTVGASGGGEQGTGATPLYWTTSGNAVYAQNVTTGASVICTGSGYSG